MITIQEDFFHLSPQCQLVMLQLLRLTENGTSKISERKLAAAAGMTYQQCRTTVNRLVKEEWITVDGGSFSNFSICNWKHQVIKSDSVKTREQNMAALKARQEKFYNLLIPFLQTYSKEMIRAFYNYWSEPNKSCTKMRKELEKTWQLDRRLQTWSSNEKVYGTSKNIEHSKEVESRRQDATSRVSRLIAEDDARG